MLTQTHRTIRKKLLAIILLIASLATASLLQGCLVASIGAGIGAARYGGAKQRDAYANYRIEMEKLNLEREKSGLEIQPIMTYEEWAEGTK